MKNKPIIILDLILWEDEDPKQETLEEVAEKSAIEQMEAGNSAYILGFIQGVKHQQEQDKKLYSEEEIIEIINSFEKLCYNYQSNKDWFPSKKTEWFEQFKKK
jgi:precorrin-4 methylase